MNTSESALQPLLDDLGRAVHGCDPLNTSETAQVMRHLSTLSVRLERENHHEMLPLCRLALALIERLSRRGVIGPDDGVAILEQLVGEIRRATLDADAVKLELERESVRKQSETNLQLIDGRKLGEILVTLSMLSPDDIEKALKKQRLTGKRFGEVLIEMRILSKEAVESALRVQSLRQGKSKTKSQDPWADSK